MDIFTGRLGVIAYRTMSAERLYILHIDPEVARKFMPSYPQRPCAEFLRIHSVRTFSPEETDVLTTVLWLCQEPDVLWDNQMNLRQCRCYAGPYPAGCELLLDRQGAADVVAACERIPMDQANVLNVFHCGEPEWETTPEKAALVWSTFQEFVSLVRTAAAAAYEEQERILIGIVVDDAK